jgi:CheY-like chemotaxis protein
MRPAHDLLRFDHAMVYVVDDEPLMLELAEISLLKLGCTVKKFTSAADALAALRLETRKPALLLTDYAMSPINGLELLEKCKEAQPRLRVVMASGTIDESCALQLTTHVDAFLSKPYDSKCLTRTIQALLARVG